MREEELKNRVAKNYFSKFDSTKILGDIDFAVCQNGGGSHFFLWAEAKQSKADMVTSIAQLILTIGRARTFDTHLPPTYLGAFDPQNIAFVPYGVVRDLFYISDFNWTVAPSNHKTKEFKHIYKKVEEAICGASLVFNFESDSKELKNFIRQNFTQNNTQTHKIAIDKNNFMVVYNKWLGAVKPNIKVDWDKVKKSGLIDGDFYLADLLSQNNESIRDSLYVLLENDKYKLDRTVDSSGLFASKTATFKDEQKAHHQFWNIYQRPPEEEYWDYIVNRRDLLVPQDIRERKGSFFTPQIWVEKSQAYIADVLGEDWQDEYYIWDPAAGTGNLLAGLTEKYNIYASTLDKQDVDVMHDRIQSGANLLENHCFQFDFLNDSFDKLPQSLQDIINDPEKRKKLLIYINPPYAEASTAKTVTGTGENKGGVAKGSKIHRQYQKEISSASNELSALFMTRIYRELADCHLALFSTLKFVNGSNFKKFRGLFRASFKKGFVAPADTFDNVKGKFPIGFTIWDLSKKQPINKVVCDVFDKTSTQIGVKHFYGQSLEVINRWIPVSLKNDLGKLSTRGNDFQNQQFIYLGNNFESRGILINVSNLTKCCMHLAVRHCIKATWLNDRDQFLTPNDGWENDSEFQNDCLAYTLFHGQNRISSKEGTNHWIPFSESEVDAKERFESHFMKDFIDGKIKEEKLSGTVNTLEKSFIPQSPLEFSKEAEEVFKAGLALWKYYHKQKDCDVNASLYDIKEYFQGRNAKSTMNKTSTDEHYTMLMRHLRERLDTLAEKIQIKVYEYGFLLP